jgi:hypothetical protein
VIGIWLAGFALACAIICARWAMELGFSLFGQLLWGLAGWLVGPFAMLILYVRLLRIAPEFARR